MRGLLLVLLFFAKNTSPIMRNSPQLKGDELMKKALANLLVTASWLWMSYLSVTYIYVMFFDEGIIDTIKYTYLNETNTFITILGVTVLLIKYPLKNIAKRINDAYYSAMTKKGSKKANKKQQVPIITIK